MNIYVENPTEHGCVKRQHETLSFHNNVVLLTDNDYGGYVAPMQIFDVKKSKWKINYANSEDGSGMDVNVNITQIPKLWTDTEACNALLTKLKISDSKQDIPEEMKITINFLPKEMSAGKGLTAIQLAKEYSYDLCDKAVRNLLEESKKPTRYADKNREQANVLRYATLCVNAQKYKYNGRTLAQIINSSKEEVMSAYRSINDPLVKTIYTDLISFIRENLDAGRDYRKCLLLDMSSMENGGSFVLLDEFKTPNNKEIDKNGNTVGKAIKITCNFGAEYPYHITLETMKGKPLKGQVGMERKNAVDHESVTFKLLQWEWTYILTQEKALLDGLVYTHVNRAYQAAVYFAQQNKANGYENPKTKAKEHANAIKQITQSTPQLSQQNNQVQPQRVQSNMKSMYY